MAVGVGLHDPMALMAELSETAAIAPRLRHFAALSLGLPAITIEGALMSDDRFSAQAARMLRNFGGQVAISVAASAVAAGVLAFPDLLVSASGERATGGGQAQATFVAADLDTTGGKFSQRHGQPADEAPGPGLALPATLLMPMSVAWSAPLPDKEAVPVALLPERAEQPVAVARANSAPSRERGRAAGAQPLQIAAVLQAAAPAAAQPDKSDKPATILGVQLPDSVTRAGRAVGGVVDTVGAAGSWTVSAASSLLPSWSGSAR